MLRELPSGELLYRSYRYVDVTKRECESFMGCEKSFTPMKLHWHIYLVFSLGIYVHETYTETDLNLIST
jgi:hypothetical protein